LLAQSKKVMLVEGVSPLFFFTADPSAAASSPSNAEREGSSWL
jgi:hypothetical protein